MESAAPPATRHVRFADRDLIVERFPFFAVVWIATSVVWLYTLASGTSALLSWPGAVATVAAELAILAPAVRAVRRLAAPGAVLAIVLAALGFLWVVTASLTSAPLPVLMPVLAAFMLVPPLFFAWSWKIELAGRSAPGRSAVGSR